MLEYLPKPVMNLTTVNEIYSGMKELVKIPTPTIRRATKDVFFLPNLSESVPNAYEATKRELMYILPVKATYNINKMHYSEIFILLK